MSNPPPPASPPPLPPVPPPTPMVLKNSTRPDVDYEYGPARRWRVSDPNNPKTPAARRISRTIGLQPALWSDHLSAWRERAQVRAGAVSKNWHFKKMPKWASPTRRPICRVEISGRVNHDKRGRDHPYRRYKVTPRLENGKGGFRAFTTKPDARKDPQPTNGLCRIWAGCRTSFQRAMFPALGDVTTSGTTSPTVGMSKVHAATRTS